MLFCLMATYLRSKDLIDEDILMMLVIFGLVELIGEYFILNALLKN